MKFNLRKYGIIAGLVAIPLTAMAAGLYTNGMPTVGAVTVNGTAQTVPNGAVSQITARMLMPVDTQLANGQAPQTVAATQFDVASLASEIAANTATSTTHAATLNTLAGTVTTESLSTAAGSTYTFTLTNSNITTTSSVPMVSFRPKTATSASVQLVSVTQASGSVDFVFKNNGTAAWNGTFILAFHL
ncbi:MAG TPA: hypothetical protein VJQ25_08480 [Nitrospira sp.]|nr:hypothetical protein [Nitrospira sp.]